MLDYQHLLDIGLSPDEETFQARMVAAASELGFGLCGGTLIRGRLASRKAAVHSFGNPPAGYLEVFKSADFGVQDPLLAKMEQQQGCLVYDQPFYVEAGAGALWESQAPWGYRHGMAVSLHERSHAGMFCFGVDSHDPLPLDLAQRRKLEGALRLLALHAQAAAQRLHTPLPVVDPGVLAGDEVESLKWAADAQSVWLRPDGMTVITNHGVGHALRRAAAKLGATSAPMAVLRAIEGGVIK